MRPANSARRRAARRARLAITPMIDVVFLLLIFFMVGMKFRELDRRVEATLPRQGDPEELRETTPELWIVIKNQGTRSQPKPKVVIDQVVMKDWDQVHARLTRLAQLPGARADTVILAPDDDALHAWVMKALDCLNQLHFQKISFKQ